MQNWNRLSPASQGIVILMAGITAFTLMDALVKALTPHYPAGQLVWARYAGQSAVVLILARGRIARLLHSAQPGMQMLRACCQLGATALFFLALGYIGLAEATAIMDVNPVLITLGGALFLGERIGPRRLAGVLVALIGALIIIRPGAAAFSPAALLPLGAAFCYASFALMTRKMAGRDSPMTSMFYAASLGTVLTSAALPWIWQPIATPLHGAGFIGIGLLGALGQLCLIRAFTLAEAGTVAPFGYLGLMLAALWGWLFFGTLPDRWTVLGALVIVGAGLYVWHRETRDAAGGARQA